MARAHIRCLPKRGTRAWRNLRSEVIRERPNVCHLCGKMLDRDAPPFTFYAIELDHILPAAFGDSGLAEVDAADQVALACYPCNRSRGSHLLLARGEQPPPLRRSGSLKYPGGDPAEDSEGEHSSSHPLHTQSPPRTFVTSRKW